MSNSRPSSSSRCSSAGAPAENSPKWDNNSVEMWLQTWIRSIHFRFMSRRPSLQVPTQFFFPNSPRGDIFDDPDYEKLLQTAEIEINKERVTISAKKLVRVKHLGSGRYGSVMECHLNERPELKFACKTIPLDLDPAKKKLILTELDVAKKVASYPYAVKMFCNLTYEADLWLVLELMDFSLDFAIKKSSKLGVGIPESAIKTVLYCCVKCLNYLKDKDIIHRDVKPPNILIRYFITSKSKFTTQLVRAKNF